MTFLAPEGLTLLVLIPIAGWCLRRGLRTRREAARSFNSRSLPHHGPRLSLFTSVLPLLALTLLALAVARPAWKREPVPITRGGRDVLFLLDVSRSMLAEDLLPNRLGAAKQAILDCVATFEGNRVGLVTFAGSPSTVCPLTTDYAFFKKMVDEASPENVDHGGTRIGDAIRKTVDKLLDPRRAGLQDVIVLSDGGDQESRPGEAARELEHYGVFLIVIGIGDDLTGARIPAGVPRGRQKPGTGGTSPEAFTMHDGQEVWSKLEPAALRSMANQITGGGAYLHAGTRTLDLGRVYKNLVHHLQSQNPTVSDSLMRWREEFFWCLALAMTALLVESLIRSLPAGKPTALAPEAATDHPGSPLPPGPLVSLTVAWCLGAGVSLASPAPARADASRPAIRPEILYNQGVQLLAADNFLEARERFTQAVQAPGKSSKKLTLKAIYNLGCSHFSLAEKGPLVGDSETIEEELATPPSDPVTEYLAAAQAFRACLDLDPNHPAAAWNYELALLRAKELETAREQEKQEPEDPPRKEKSDPGESESTRTEDEDGGDEWQETDTEDASRLADLESSQSAMDLLNQDLPPPMVDPQDLLMEEELNNASRDKRSRKNYDPTEKDW